MVPLTIELAESFARLCEAAQNSASEISPNIVGLVISSPNQKVYFLPEIQVPPGESFSRLPNDFVPDTHLTNLSLEIQAHPTGICWIGKADSSQYLIKSAFLPLDVIRALTLGVHLKNTSASQIIPECRSYIGHAAHCPSPLSH